MMSDSKMKVDLTSREATTLIVLGTAISLTVVGFLLNSQVADQLNRKCPTFEGASLWKLVAIGYAGWLSSRLLPQVVRYPWAATLTGLTCLLLPLFIGGETMEGSTRFIPLDNLLWDNSNHQYWIPGYLGLLLMLPGFVVLAASYRRTRQLRYILGHLMLFWLGMSLLLLLPDPVLALLLVVGAIFSALLAQPKGPAAYIVLLLGCFLVLGCSGFMYGQGQVFPWVFPSPELVESQYLLLSWLKAG